MRGLGDLVKNTATTLGGLGLVTAAVANVVQVKQLLEESFWLLLGVSWLLLTAALWPGEVRKAGLVGSTTSSGVRRFRGVFAATVTVLLLGSWRSWEVRRSRFGRELAIPPPSTLVAPQPAMGESAPVIGGAAPVLSQFVLETGMTAYVSEAGDPEGPADLTYRMGIDLDEGGEATDFWFEHVPANAKKDHGPNVEFLLSYALRDRCRQYWQTPSHREELERFLRGSGRMGLVKYLEEGDPVDLTVRRQDLVAKMIPTDQERDALRALGLLSAAESWVDNCVGRPFPVFSVTLENPGDRDLAVSSVRYWVVDSRHSCAAGATPDLLWPVFRYSHGIRARVEEVPEREWITYPDAGASLERYMRNERERGTPGLVPPPLDYPLTPGVLLKANGVAKFELMWYLEPPHGCHCPDGRHELLLSVEFGTSSGRVRTREFWWETLVVRRQELSEG